MGWRKRDFLYAIGCLGAIKLGADLVEDSQTEVSEATPSPERDGPATTTQIPASTTLTSEPADPPHMDIVIAHHGSRPNQVEFTCDIEVSDGIQSLSLSVVEPTRQVKHQGLNEQREDYNGPNGDEYVSYEWDGESSACHFEFVIDVSNRQNEAFGGRDYAGTEEWVFAPAPGLAVSWSDAQTDGIELPSVLYPLASRDANHVQVEVNKPAKLGNQLIFIGDFEDHSYVGEEQLFSLIVPSHADPPAHDEIFETLDFASERLRVGELTDEITAFITTDPIRRGGVNMPESPLKSFQTQSEKSVSEFWVHEDSSLTSPNNSVVHEYVHTRQNFHLDSEMEWFREASAEYYAARITYAQRAVLAVMKGDVTEHLYPDEQYADQILAAKDNWSDARVPYRKGGYVLLALDELIRDRSDEEAFLQTVFYEMNAAEEEVTYPRFVELVSEAAGTSLDDWCVQYVNGDGLPPVPEGWERDNLLSTDTA